MRRGSRSSCNLRRYQLKPDSEATKKVLVVDFGGQYSQLIARRVRECRVYSELIPYDTPVEEIRAARPSGLIFSGGPRSVNEPGAPTVDPEIFALGVPILGICYGLQLMAKLKGGRVERLEAAEYGGRQVTVTKQGPLFAGLPAEMPCWMSHGDSVSVTPAGFTVTATSPNMPVAAMEDPSCGLYGVQFHPEVRAHQVRAGDPQELPLQGVRHRPDVDRRLDHRSGDRAHPGAGG